MSEGRGAPCTITALTSGTRCLGGGRQFDNGGEERERELWGASVYLRGQRRQAARYGGAVEKHDENGVATAGGRTQANPNASQGVAEPGHSDPTSRTTSILTPWLRQVLVCSCFPYAHRHRRRCVTDRTYVAPKASE